MVISLFGRKTETVAKSFGNPNLTQVGKQELADTARKIPGIADEMDEIFKISADGNDGALREVRLVLMPHHDNNNKADLLSVHSIRSYQSPYRLHPPAERITIGMISIGCQVCAYNLPWFLKSPETQVVAVFDIDSWRLENPRNMIIKHVGSVSKAVTTC